MRKVLVLFLSILLTLTFSACGGNSDNVQDANQVTVPDIRVSMDIRAGKDISLLDG